MKSRFEAKMILRKEEIWMKHHAGNKETQDVLLCATKVISPPTSRGCGRKRTLFATHNINLA